MNVLGFLPFAIFILAIFCFKMIVDMIIYLGFNYSTSRNVFLFQLLDVVGRQRLNGLAIVYEFIGCICVLYTDIGKEIIAMKKKRNVPSSSRGFEGMIFSSLPTNSYSSPKGWPIMLFVLNLPNFPKFISLYCTIRCGD